YNAFDPFEPLPAGDPAYVDCAEVRGDTNILVDLGNKLLRSQRMVCQLYTGHRGGGKSTELLRLKDHLEKNGCVVVYFAADEDDIDPEDAEYTDILLSCTRHLLEELKNADPAPILGWLGDRWQDLKELALTKISFEKLSVEAQISEFAKLTASIRAIPSERQKIRELVNPHTITLLKALNEFIDDAKRKLPKGKTHLVAIADNLDRIVPIPQEHGRTNHDEIFLDRAQQLQGLNCHIIYTIPISMVYSSRAADLRDIYGDPQVLPMIMVQTPDGKTDEAGIAKIIEIITKRINRTDLNLVPDIFASLEGLQRICLMSGGNVRNLILLVRSSIVYIDTLPITDKAIQRSINQARDTYRHIIEPEEWELLAKVAQYKQIDNDEDYRKLLFNRSVLQYIYFDPDGELQPWYDVHPLIKSIQQFKDAFQSMVTQIQQINQSNLSPDKIHIYGNNEQLYVNIQNIKHPLLSTDAELIKVMDEAEKLYAQKIDEENYLEASQIARDIHEMYERVAESLKMKQDSDEYSDAIQWSSYWKIRQQTNARRIRSN
ncbi:MAG: hypothetical protein ACK5SD_13185, partial [Pseudanabaena sp.]